RVVNKLISKRILIHRMLLDTQHFDVACKQIISLEESIPALEKVDSGDDFNLFVLEDDKDENSTEKLTEKLFG
ncbi:hypothetical protein PMAYCL1PPCAC_03534, partial [Pristionchus mayeri]